MIRGCAFFLFASASWALLPLIAKDLRDGGPQAFGLLVAAIGAGAVGGAFLLPRLRERLSSDVLVASATVCYASAMLTLALLDQLLLLCLVMALSGMAWITVLSSLQVAAQMALPNWVRSRGLAVFMTLFMGSMALGSLIWGQVATMLGLSSALIIATVGALAGIVLSWRWRIGGSDSVDLSPSLHWPTPVIHDAVTSDRGPVLITIQYQVRDEHTADFLRLIRKLGQHRRRNGAFAWSVFEHTEQRNHFIESFNAESWLEHLRQHERVTQAERTLQEEIRSLLQDGSDAIVIHYVAPTD